MKHVNLDSIPIRHNKIFYPLQDRLEVHTISYLVSAGQKFPGDKAAGA
jgi:hypothetical protein